VDKPTAFPTVFPADAAKQIGQAILNRQFTLALIEPLYDLIGYGFHALGLGALPSPTPTPPVPADPAAKMYTMGDFGLEQPDSDHELVGRYLLAAAEVHHPRYSATAIDATAAAEAAKALPWGSILSVLLTIIQGLVLALGKNPIPVPTPAPTPDPQPTP
jgi:hypothetical protein